MKVQIVLVDADGIETELGPFNQGVVIHGGSVVDVATGHKVVFTNMFSGNAFIEPGWGRGRHEAVTNPHKPYKSFFIQGV